MPDCPATRTPKSPIRDHSQASQGRFGPGFGLHTGLALAIAWVWSLLGLVSCAPSTPVASSSPAFSGCPAAPTDHPALAQATTAHPPLFRVETDRGGALFLLGTIHLGPPEGWHLSPRLEAILAEATTLVLEVDLRAADEETVSTIVANSALLPPGVRLEDRLAPETRALLEERSETLAGIGFPPSIRDLMKPWFLALGILESQVQRTPYRTATATEQQLLEARGDAELIGLETVEEQMAFFDTLPAELQDLILRDALARYDEAPNAIDELVRAWRTGDAASLECFSREGVEALPGLDDFYEILLDGRNRAWISRLDMLLESESHAESHILFAVGALHLYGEQGLPAQLRRAGYRVEPVDQREAP